MKKCTTYILSKEEATELLQNTLDDSRLRLVKDPAGFYAAVSDANFNFLDRNQVDEKLAQALGIENSVHFALEDGRIIVVPQTSGRV